MASKRLVALLDPAFDFITSRQDGVTIEELADELDISHNSARIVCRHLRRIFADSKENLVGEPEGHRQSWRFRFTGDPEKARFWISNRLNDTEARLGTIRDVAHSIVLASDQRTIAGKKALKIHRTLVRLEEDLAEITANG